MKKIVISLLLLAVYDVTVRASDTNAAMPKPQLNQALLKRANETFNNPGVDKEEKVKVHKALANYNQEQTKKTSRVLNGAIDRAQPGAREAQHNAVATSDEEESELSDDSEYGSQVQIASASNFFGEEDKERMIAISLCQLSVIAPSTQRLTARAQLARNRRDARAQQLAQRRQSSSDDEESE